MTIAAYGEPAPAGTVKKLEKRSPKALLAAVFMLSLLPFTLVELLPSRFYRTMDVASYLVFHNSAEFFSVMVSLSIFGVGWFTSDQSKNRHVLFLSCAFLAVGLMDFMHTLGYSGMPAFITPNSPNKSTQFWIAVRMYSALAFLVSASVQPEASGRFLAKSVLLASAVVVPTVVFTGVIYFPAQIPATFIEGQGLTAFKMYAEYLIMLLFAFSIPAYWRRYAQTGKTQLLYFIAALILCIFSELAFSGYQSVFDTYNVLGHVYKILAFALIYRGIFVAAVDAPYLEAVRAREEWQKTFDSITAPIMILDREFRILRANTTMATALGLTPAEAVGRTCYEVVHGTHEPPLACPHAALLSNGARHRAEIYEKRLGGWYCITADPLYGPDGQLVGSIHFGEDITERVRTEKELKESDERFKSFMRNFPGLAYIKDHDGLVLFANEGFSRFLGLDPATMPGKTNSDLFPAEFAEKITRDDRQILESGRNETVEEVFAGRHWITYKFPIPQIGAPPQLGGLTIDITERKKMEDEIRVSAMEWSAAMDASQDVIYLLDPGRRVMRANKAFYSLTRSTPETARGRHIAELVHPGGEKDPCPVCLAQEEKRDFTLVMEPDHPDNPAGKPIEINLRIIRDNEGGSTSMLMTLHDLTHDRAVQEELTQYRMHLEELVRTRTAELLKKTEHLERLNRAFVERELRMRDLKERIKELEDIRGQRSI